MIYLPPPQPILNKDIRISGDVEINPTASLAPGVILQAASNSRIVIGADVCIGMGVIINACKGSVEIGDGAILGAGVLIVGESKIGNSSCVGTSTTIFRHNVASMAVVEPGSILGDISRQMNLEESQKTTQTDAQSKSEPPKSSQKSQKTGSNSHSNYYYAAQPNQSKEHNSHQEQNSDSIPQVEVSVEPQVKQEKAPVVGEVYINELLVTLFPHNKGSSPNKKNLSE